MPAAEPPATLGVSGTYCFKPMPKFILILATCLSSLLILITSTHPCHALLLYHHDNLVPAMGQAHWQFTSTRLSAGIDNVLAEARTGAIFVTTTQGDLLKYSANLTLEAHSSHFTRDANLQMAPERHYETKVLTILEHHSQQRALNHGKLLACALSFANSSPSTQEPPSALVCRLYNPANLTGQRPSPVTWAHANGRSLTIVSGPGEQLQLTHLGPRKNLLTASRREQFASPELEHVLNSTSAAAAAAAAAASNKYHYLPAVGRFELNDRAQLKMTALLPYRTKLPDSRVPLYDYVYTFAAENYTYFVLNDIERGGGGGEKAHEYKTRLARVCQTDTRLTSYIEVAIECYADSEDDLYARVAYLDGTTLFVLYESVKLIGKNHEEASSDSAHLCSYSLAKIQEVFARATKKCYNGHSLGAGGGGLLAKLGPWQGGRPLSCRKNQQQHQQQQQQEFCLNPLNPYIDGYSDKAPVGADTHQELGQGWSHANFLLSLTQGPGPGPGARVHFVGFEAGWLAKFGPSQDNSDLFYVDLFQKRVAVYPLERTLELAPESNSWEYTPEQLHAKTRFVYSESTQTITALHLGRELYQLPVVDTCQHYATCFACSTVNDPLECAWCAGRCAKRIDCAAQSSGAAPPAQNRTASCPPSIHSFTPRSGPTSAGPTPTSNTLVIFGDGLGGDSHLPSVLVGEQECVVDATKTDTNKIECSLEAPLEPGEFQVSVTQTDNLLDGVHMEGTATTRALYEYKRVLVFGLNGTQAGPAGGGTELRIEGDNLDAGRRRKVTLGNTACQVLTTEPSHITCRTQPLNLTPSEAAALAADSLLVVQPLRVFIDDIWPVAQQPSSANLSSEFHFRLETTPAAAARANRWFLETTNLLIGLGGVLALVLLVGGAAFVALNWNQDLDDGAGEGGKRVGDGIVQRRMGALSPSASETPSESTRPNSLTGLIKLDESHMGSGDYFARLEQMRAAAAAASLHNSISARMRSLLLHEQVLIDPSRLTLGHVLGAGQFARVYKGYLQPTGTSGEPVLAVAVKTLHERPTRWGSSSGSGSGPGGKGAGGGGGSYNNRGSFYGEDFLEEGLIMKDFHHENVLGLVGVSFDTTSGLPMVITPFMLYGDLKSYISEASLGAGGGGGAAPPSAESVREFVGFGVQVARGMEYLANLKFIHRDLAARNCMLDERKIVKVADFGLSRDIYERDYYSSDSRGAKLPVKWMAIESLGESLYSTKSDVWSYGVLLWELMAHQPGLVPYADVDNFDILNYLRAGRRLARPRHCPASLYRVMVACWQADPGARPAFDELATSVARVLDELGSDDTKTSAHELTPSEQALLATAAKRQLSAQSDDSVAGADQPVTPPHAVGGTPPDSGAPNPTAEPQQSSDHEQEEEEQAECVAELRPGQCMMSMQAAATGADNAQRHSVDLDGMSLAEQARYLGVAFYGSCFETAPQAGTQDET